MSKNERLKRVNIDKIALFLNNKYNKVFQDKNFSMNALKYEISRLLVGKNMKVFNFNESIKKIEKSILKTVSNYGEIKYEPVQMDKINNLLSYNILKPQRIQSAIPKVNKLNLNNNNNVKKNLNEVPYPTEKMEKLREREKNKWAIQANKEYEEYLKEQDKLKRDNYEKKLKQRKILEEQIKERKEYEQKMRQEEKNVQPYATSLKFDEVEFNYNNRVNNMKEKENKRRPLSSKPMIKRRKEEIEYQKQIEEDLKKYQEQENMKKKILRDKYKEMQKENYENAIKKKKEKIKEKEIEKSEKNNVNIFDKEDNRAKEIFLKNQLKVEQFSKNKINQNIKHQLAINNYENQKYKKEIEQEKKRFINEELAQNEKKKKMMDDFKKGLDAQIKEKQRLKELKDKEKINENKDNLNVNNQIMEENNIRNKAKYEKINNYKRELDEQVERNRKIKQNE